MHSRFLVRLWGGLIFFGTLILGYLYLNRPKRLGTLSRAAQTKKIGTTYEQAVARIQKLQAEDAAQIHPKCNTQFLTHGRKVEETIVFLHGFTNCPRQFHLLASQWYDQGYNVLVPRMPHHGYEDLLTTQLASLSAESLVDLANETVDIALGLGERITVVGISMGGVVASWIAQHRVEVDHTVIISPSFGVQVIPERWTVLATNWALLMPNRFLWWDPNRKDAPHEPLHAYPRFSTHSLSQVIRLGLVIRAEAKRAKPLTKSITTILNPTDQVVDNPVTASVINHWRRNGAEIFTYEFDSSFNLIHDLIDPDQQQAQIALVYPILTQLINRHEDHTLSNSIFSHSASCLASSSFR